MRKRLVKVVTTLVLLLHGFSVSWAQNDAGTEKHSSVISLDEMLVSPSVLNFDFSPNTSSRLDLPVFETPAAITVINNAELKNGGYQEVGEALNRTPGYVWGNPPAEPANFSMRGFTSNQVMLLRDGIWLGPALISGRPQNSFNLDRIEVLKGPASVLHGQGAIGATINMITKKPQLGGSNTYEILSSYGRYDTVKAGVGAGGALGENLWFRLDASQYSSNGYVDDADPKSRNLIASLLWKPNDQLDVTVGFDVLKDKLQNYWGTPLVTEAFATQPLTGVVSTTDGRTIDERMRFVNYNVGDEVADSYQILTTIDAKWKHSNKLSFRNYVYFFDAEREWRNAEQYTFNSGTSLIDRDRFFVDHDQNTIGNRLSATYKNTLAGLDNQTLFGIDASYVDFRRRTLTDKDPQLTADSVDPFAPGGGTFGSTAQSTFLRINPTKIITVSAFFEDTLKITPKLRLVAGLRQDHIDLDRINLDEFAGGSFQRTFNPFSWRLGAVYEVQPSWNVYAQMSSGTDPLGDDVFLVENNQNFKLSTSQQWEAGLKSRFLDGRAEMALSIYHIERQNTVVKDSTADENVLSNVGTQRSTGFELEGSLLVTPKWRIGANTAFTHAEFGVFAGNSGNTPSNIPEWVGNAWTSYRGVGGFPLDVGGSLRYVGERFNDKTNVVKMLGYETVDVHATYRMRMGRFTARLTNLFDKAYALWGDEFYKNQLILGSPRSYEISAQFDF